MANNTPARIYLNGVEQHHVRDYSTSAGWLIKRKTNPDGSVAIDPKTRQMALERLEGEVVAIGDDKYVGVDVEYTPVGGTASAGDPVVKVHVTVERKSGAKDMVGSVAV